MWTKAQVKAFQAALAACDKWEAVIDTLRDMAKAVPANAQRIEELHMLCETLRQMASSALAVDPAGVGAPQEGG